MNAQLKGTATPLYPNPARWQLEGGRAGQAERDYKAARSLPQESRLTGPAGSCNQAAQKFNRPIRITLRQLKTRQLVQAAQGPQQATDLADEDVWKTDTIQSWVERNGQDAEEALANVMEHDEGKIWGTTAAGDRLVEGKV
eukprot:2150467-Rhodomonas_salina.1